MEFLLINFRVQALAYQPREITDDCIFNSIDNRLCVIVERRVEKNRSAGELLKFIGAGIVWCA